MNFFVPFNNQLCFDLETWFACIRRRRKNLNQCKFGPVYKCDFILSYGILILGFHAKHFWNPWSKPIHPLMVWFTGAKVSFKSSSGHCVWASNSSICWESQKQCHTWLRSSYVRNLRIDWLVKLHIKEKGFFFFLFLP